MVEVVVTIGAISHAKLQSDYHHQQTNTQFFYRPDALPCRPTNSVKALKGSMGVMVYINLIIIVMIIIIIISPCRPQ